jgi:hypothetical protein
MLALLQKQEQDKPSNPEQDRHQWRTLPPQAREQATCKEGEYGDVLWQRLPALTYWQYSLTGSQPDFAHALPHLPPGFLILDAKLFAFLNSFYRSVVYGRRIIRDGMSPGDTWYTVLS